MPPLIQPVLSALAYHQPVIQGENMVLRPWCSGDGAQLKAALRDGEIRRWNLHEFANIAEAREWVDHSMRRWRKRRGASWAVIRPRHPDIVLGQIGFRSLYLADGLAELSCWIMPRARRQGVATEATRLLSQWAFDTLGMERLEIIHSVRNTASCPVALLAGFQIEGIKRRLQRHADGFHDMCLHSRISTDDGKPITIPIPIAQPVTPAPPPAEVTPRWPRSVLSSGRRRGKSPELVGGRS